MQFFTSALVAITLALSAMAVTSPAISREILDKRCSTPAPAPAAAAAAKAAPAPVSNAAASFLAGTQTGQGTWYSTGLGACGITNTDTDHIAAVSRVLYDEYPGYAGGNPNNNPVCGRQIKANYQGKSVTVAVTDRCEACQETDLDFSPAAFTALADQSVGRLSDVTWSWA